MVKKYTVPFICLLSVLSLNIYFRAFPVNFPQLRTKAKETIEQRIRKEAIVEVNKKFPEYSSLAKDKLIRNLVRGRNREKQIIKVRIQEEYLKLKDKYQDASGQTYLMELDCWHWARYVENTSSLGHPGDKIVNGRQFDTLMLAPEGAYLAWNNFLFYFSSFLYKGFSIIKLVPLYTFLFYLPLFFTAIFIITLYLFCLHYWGNLCAVISCLFVGLAPIFLQRSSAGWFDTDILNLFFPLIIIWTYLIANDSPSFRQKVLWICFSGFWAGLFCFTWIDWWFIFLIVIIYEIYSLFSSFRGHILSLGLFLAFSFAWITLFSGTQPRSVLYSQVKEALSLNNPLTGSIWPNVLSTVGELKKADFLQVISPAGGIVLFVSSLACLLNLFSRAFFKRRKDGVFKQDLIIIFMVWFVSMLFACSKGIRFTMFLLLPLGVSLGWLINEAYAYFKNRRMKWPALLAAAITLVLAVECINNAGNQAKDIFPLMDDTMYAALSGIKESTPQRAIINSWWDYGDWYKAAAKRRVIFDGQSQNTPQAYWMASVLMASNEDEAVNILRMLNNGGNRAFEIINKQLNDSYKSVLLLKKAVSSDLHKAEKILNASLPEGTVQEVIKLIFAKPEKAYFAVDSTMQDKISAISYIGNFDFIKGYIWQNFKKTGKNQILDYLAKSGVDKQQAQSFYQEAGLISSENSGDWVSQRVKFHSGLVKGQEQNDIVLFDNGFVYRPKQQIIYVYSPSDKKYKIPKSIFVLKKDKIEEITCPGGNLDYSVLVIKNKEDYQAILLDRRLANSLFSRLYFLNGIGLKHFKPFIEKKDEDTRVKIFEIIWD